MAVKGEGGFPLPVGVSAAKSQGGASLCGDGPRPWLATLLSRREVRAACALLLVACADPPALVDTAPSDTGPGVGWTRDGDGDGYGDSVDCDDADPAVFPGAVESCDGRDDDCDGVIDEGACVEGGAQSLATFVTIAGAPDQWAGWSVAALGDRDGDGAAEIGAGAPMDDAAGEEAGALLVAESPFEAGFTALHTGATLDRLGYAVAAGAGVYVVTAPYAGGGEAWVVGEGTRVWAAAAPRSHLGEAVAVGEIGGADVVALGAPAEDSAGWGAGAVYLARVDALDLEDATVLSGGAGDEAGASVAAVGDTDGDGLGDLVVGCPGAGERTGAVVWLAGPPIDLASGVRHEGASGDGLGATVVGLGDVDGDGRADWAVSAPTVDAANTGAVWIVTSTGALAEQPRLSGAGPFDYAGGGLAGPGDVDGDGLADVAVAASGVDEGGADAGAVYMAFGPFVGTRGLGEGAVRLDAAPHEQVSVVAAGGDLDADAVPDLLVGVWRADATSGAVYIVPGAALR